MVIIEKTKESDIYIFHEGTENEMRLEWKLEDDDLPRQNPPFMLEGDILSYVKEIESILNVTKGDNLEIVEKRYRGLNNVLARMVKENEGYVVEIEVKCSEIGDCVGDECGRILVEGGIESSCKTLDMILPPIKNLVDCEWGYAMVNGEVFHVRDWWLKEGKFGLYPGVVVLYILWVFLNKNVEEKHHLFEEIGHKVKDVTPAYATYRMMERFKKSEARFDHPVYTVTGIRHHMGENLTDEERTAAAERFLAALKKNQKVLLVAEPDNPADPKAIAAYIDYKRIGYIARENTDEVSALLDNNGQCDAVVERVDGHVTFFVSIPGSHNKTNVRALRPRQLPESPLGEDVRMPFEDDEKTLQVVATRLINMEVTIRNIHEIICLANRYVPLRKLSICFDDTLWRDKISKILYKILYGSRFPLLLKDEERKLGEIIYELVYRAIGDMRSTKEHWPERVFLEHLDRLRNNSSINQHLYKKYCDEFLDGKDFTDADKALVAKEYERLRGWLKKMKWKELRNPDNLQAMGLKVNHLGLSRQELYDLYSVLLLIEKLKDAMQLESASNSDNQTEEELNYFQPTKHLQDLLKQPWFNEARSEEKYDSKWTDAFVEALMGSEYGEGIARDWAWNIGGERNRHIQIKGYVVGLLVDAGVLKGSKRSIAKRIVEDQNDREMDEEDFWKEVGKLSRKMYTDTAGKQPYAQWVKEYVKGNS